MKRKRHSTSPVQKGGKSDLLSFLLCHSFFLTFSHDFANPCIILYVISVVSQDASLSPYTLSSSPAPFHTSWHIFPHVCFICPFRSSSFFIPYVDASLGCKDFHTASIRSQMRWRKSLSRQSVNREGSQVSQSRKKEHEQYMPGSTRNTKYPCGWHYGHERERREVAWDSACKRGDNKGVCMCVIECKCVKRWEGRAWGRDCWSKRGMGLHDGGEEREMGVG